MARAQGKPFFIVDHRKCLPEAEKLRRQALMDMAFATAPDRDGDTVLVSDSLEGPFVPLEAWPDAMKADMVALFAAKVRDRLGYFLEMIDRCDVLFQDRAGDKLVFLVAVDAEENVALVCRAISDERTMLDELGIDRNDVNVDRGMVRVLVQVPADLQPC